MHSERSGKQALQAPKSQQTQEAQEGAVVKRGARRRFSRGASMTPYVPGGRHRDEVNEVNDAEHVEDEGLSPSAASSTFQPYVKAELPYLGAVAPSISTGSRLRMIAFDFDQTLAATHLFFRLKNQQSRARASKMSDGREVPSLVKLLMSGAVPSDEIWGSQARLIELKGHLEELSSLGVFMAVITKGSGRVVDLALQLAGLRDHFQVVLDPQTSVGAKLMTVQVLMNTALGERLRPQEAVLVDDDLKNLIVDISSEELAALPPVFQAVEPVDPCVGELIEGNDFQQGHLTDPVTVCRLMRAENGVKAWQLRELVNAAWPRAVE